MDHSNNISAINQHEGPVETQHCDSTVTAEQETPATPRQHQQETPATPRQHQNERRHRSILQFSSETKSIKSMK